MTRVFPLNMATTALLLVVAVHFGFFSVSEAFEFLTKITQNSSTDSPWKRGEVCKVVLQDHVRGYMNWNQEWFVKACSAQNIKIIEIKDPGNLKTREASVVVFHAPTHRSKIGDGMRARYSGALFAMLSMEQPNYAPMLKEFAYLQNNFDLMVTYSLSSTYPGTSLPNMPITYYPSHILPPEAVLRPSLSFQAKNGFDTGVSVALFTSNCKAAGASERLKYLQDLMKHVEVHSYGGCLNNRKEPELPVDPSWPSIAQRRARKIKVLSQYRFYLAFENAPIDDYVSEKVFEGLFAGSVPIYRGSRSIHRFMPSNDSFIDANEMSPAALGALIKKASADEALYSRYFAFKSRPLDPQFLRITEMSYVHPNVLARLCNYSKQRSNTDGKSTSAGKV